MLSVFLVLLTTLVMWVVSVAVIVSTAIQVSQIAGMVGAFLSVLVLSLVMMILSALIIGLVTMAAKGKRQPAKM